jgi:hypothetical protein
MKKTILALAAFALFAACNNSKKETPAGEQKDNTKTTTTTETDNVSPPPSGKQSAMVTIDGKDISLSGSVLVGKDKEKLQPGLDFMAMVTGSNGSDHESLTLNFIFALEPGDYPVVGTSFLRGDGDKAEMYGGLLGGKPKITEYKVHLTEVKDLGSNNLGGHKWNISGNFDRIVIPAMGLMMMDKTKNHPKEVVIDKGSFSNLQFDDNWEEIMNKAFDKLKDNKKEE